MQTKLFRVITVSGLAIFVMYFAFLKPKEVVIDGDWAVKKIILDQKLIFPKDAMDSLYPDLGPTLMVNEWNDSLYISTTDKISARFQTKWDDNGKHKIKLASTEKSLNDTFDITIDTVYVAPLLFQINVKIQSARSSLFFYRELRLKPWKPEFPRRGQV